MKVASVTKLDKKNKTRPKKFDDDFFFPIYGQFGAIRKPDSRRIACKNYISINSNLLSYKN